MCEILGNMYRQYIYLWMYLSNANAAHTVIVFGKYWEICINIKIYIYGCNANAAHTAIVCVKYWEICIHIMIYIYGCTCVIQMWPIILPIHVSYF